MDSGQTSVTFGWSHGFERFSSTQGALPPPPPLPPQRCPVQPNSQQCRCCLKGSSLVVLNHHEPVVIQLRIALPTPGRSLDRHADRSAGDFITTQTKGVYVT
ncbi:hypothetical protein INR49_026489 [Caranx melampygus]|nr:hypothetical protein INR49_026489 [Caranx melampygus]